MDNYSQSFDRLNPARQMLTKTQKQPINSKGSTKNNALELNTDAQNVTLEPKKEETRSKRLQVLIKPSTLKALDKVAEKHKTSRNDIINKVLEAYIERK